MSALVDGLKKEHASLVQVLEQVRALGISSEQGRKLLFSAKAALLAHLGKENDQLYPALRKAAEKEPHLKSTLDSFAKDMEGVASAALQFFARYEKGEAHGLEFGKDFGRLFAMLGDRIRREETILYKEFDRLRA